MFVFGIKQAALASLVSWNLARRLSLVRKGSLLVVGGPDYLGWPIYGGLKLRAQCRLAGIAH
jgi:hypothetical protein